jgi:hypothetical protein
VFAAIGVGHQMLEPVLDPFDRPAELERGPRDRDRLAVEMGLEPEPAADVRADHADVLDCEPEMLGDAALHRVRQLMRHPDDKLVEPTVVMGAGTAAFHGKRRLARHAVDPADGVGGILLRRFQIAVFERGLAEHVVAPRLVNDRDAGRARLVEVVDRLQFLAVDLDGIGDVLGLGPRRRDGHGDLLAHVTHLVLGKDGEVGRLEAGERCRRTDRLYIGEIGRGEDLAFGTLGRRYAAEAAMRHLAAAKRRVPQARDLDIGHVFATAVQKPVVFLAGNAGANAAIAHKGLPLIRAHLFVPLPDTCPRTRRPRGCGQDRGFC